ncbi:asparagine synthase (glutamine-hydrolyzing) [Alphaproteobacteria bacterium]|nr:asparagine synthase (glutamine-hydrolyzing) [Alphaproteobacteria bacterium]
MCGVSGIISKTGFPDKNKIISMNGMISHRGPDQSGYLEYKNLLLGHVRLSVLDITDKGRQPMSVDGRYWIIFNGEVYNYNEIKDNLISKQYKFFSKTDTEVVLNAFIEWGEECFKKFNGDWVIVILDKKTNKLLIARDGIGCKPCYLYEDNHTFAFSSEIKGLFGLNPNIDFDYNNLGIDPTTLFSCSKTFFKDISQLPPGRLIKINLKTQDKKIQRWNYPLEHLPSIHPNYLRNQGEYFELLYNATKIRLDADLKIGTSLSGGIDSSAIFTLLNLIQNNEKLIDNKKIDLNPIIMNYSGCKTTKEAIEVAKNNDKKYKLLEFKEDNIENIIKLLAKLEVIEEYNMQPLLYQTQKKLGIHISIDGHGADEFLGLPSFIPNLSIDAFNHIISLRSAVNTFGNSKYQQLINNLLGEAGLNNEGLLKNKIMFEPHLYTNNFFQNYTQANKFNDDDNLIYDDKEILGEFDYATQYTYMVGYCGWMQFFLSKWDRASMSSAVEVRSPFLDVNVRQYSLALPLNKKINNGFTKSILRDSMEPYLPVSITTQTFKQGLPKQKFHFDNSTNHQYLNNILNEKNFKESNVWDSKLIYKEFKEGRDTNNIWDLCKHYLMREGFKKTYEKTNQIYDKEFYLPNNLSLN